MTNPPAPARRNARKRWLTLAQIVISVGLLAWMLKQVGPREVIQQMAGIDPAWYGAAVAVFLLSVLVRAYRWQILLHSLGIKSGLLDLFRLYLLGFFWNSFLPTGFGGDVAKVIALQRITGQGAESTSSVLAERLVGLLGTSLIALLVLLIWPGLVTPALFGAVVAVCIGIVAVGWFVRLDVLDWLDARVPALQRLTRSPKLVRFHEALRAYSLRTYALALLASVPFTVSLIVTNYLIGLAFDVHIPLRYFAIFTPIVSVVNLLPLSFNGLGVREYMYQLLFVPIGVPVEVAITMALAFNLMRILTGLLGGLLSVAGGARRLAGARPAPLAVDPPAND